MPVETRKALNWRPFPVKIEYEFGRMLSTGFPIGDGPGPGENSFTLIFAVVFTGIEFEPGCAYSALIFVVPGLTP